MPLMIGSEAAFSLPCCGSSMAILTLPFEVSAAGAGVLGVRAAPLPPLGAADVPGLLLHAANTSIDTPATAASFLKFIQSPPRTDRPGGPRVDLGRCARGQSEQRVQANRSLPVRLARGSVDSPLGLGFERLASAGVAVRDGRRHRIPVRAARRMPPKRCRIICIGGPI